MNAKLRAQRNVFLMYMGTCVVALMCALPIVAAQTPPQQQASKKDAPSAAAGASRPAAIPSFKQADRNHDGLLDKSETFVIPGLSANFERADTNKDGKLDEVEFARGLEILQVRR